ncbi:hypothetical protein [Streptomyces ureilyticus]|uniref:Uncharacterized protein n=1 Tax=Streptomyces ureilyticus TaxID=1775131 RepID=A0ABX0E5L1_9ACTN|nr:hypothetical protein [Streptomyces ureilyticus]NGO48832.1 hypothetical protein [Streptomyces ureilyticus]
MTTRSPFPPDHSGIPVEVEADAHPPPTAPPVHHLGSAAPAREEEPAATPLHTPLGPVVMPFLDLPSAAGEDDLDFGVSHADPVAGLVHAAAVDRPLDEVIELVELLEESPEYASATVDALRAVGTDRSVDDVIRLVAALTRPPRKADSADDVIRAAVRSRPVEDVTRLMAFLHLSRQDPHCAEEAARAAATSRPVEELVQLIGRLAHERDVPPERQPVREASRQSAAGPAMAGPEDRPSAALGAVGHGTPIKRDQTAKDSIPPAGPAWLPWVAATALVLCGLAHFPPDAGSASAAAYGFTMGASMLCVVLALALAVAPALFRKGRLPLLAAGVVLPTALAVAQLLESQIYSPGLTSALAITAAPPWAANLAATLAALTALTALLMLLPSPSGQDRGPR